MALGFAGIFMLNNPHHLVVFTHDSSVTARVSQLHRQQANAALGFRGHQTLQSIDRNQRDVAVQHQHVFIIGKMRGRLLHGMAGTQLLGLQYPVQCAVGQGVFQQVAAMAVHQMDVFRAQFHRGINDVLHHRLAGQRM
ncbi:hypothetical protein D3C78_1475160 [compost metagenome]